MSKNNTINTIDEIKPTIYKIGTYDDDTNGIVCRTKLFMSAPVLLIAEGEMHIASFTKRVSFLPGEDPFYQTEAWMVDGRYISIGEDDHWMDLSRMDEIPDTIKGLIDYNHITPNCETVPAWKNAQ